MDNGVGLCRLQQDDDDELELFFSAGADRVAHLMYIAKYMARGNTVCVNLTGWEKLEARCRVVKKSAT